ncbi:MAG TPA: hypothetical protein VNA21_04960 [Steroidobacteraceae bacterium]|nr:hypothetical protein [Steroidobacteraceae bacterium]
MHIARWYILDVDAGGRHRNEELSLHLFVFATAAGELKTSNAAR